MIHTIAGGVCLCFALGSTTSWGAAYIMRTFELDVAMTGISLGLRSATIGISGILVGGFAADFLSKRRAGDGFRYLALASGLGVVSRLISLSVENFLVYLLFSAVAIFFWIMYLAPTYAAVQSAVTPDARSRASALLLLFLYGIVIASGAFFTGVMSDIPASRFGSQSLLGNAGVPASSLAVFRCGESF